MRAFAFAALMLSVHALVLGGTKHDFPYAVMVFEKHPDLPIESEDGAEVLYRMVEGCLSMNMWSSEDDDQKTADAATRLLRVYFPRTKWLEMAERRRDPYGVAPLR